MLGMSQLRLGKLKEPLQFVNMSCTLTPSIQISELMFSLDALIRGIVLGSHPLESMEEYEDIKSEALSLYKSYKCNEEHLISNRLSHIRNFIKNSISDSQANAMCIEVALDVIQVHISLNPNKALDPYGLNGHFLGKA